MDIHNMFSVQILAKSANRLTLRHNYYHSVIAVAISVPVVLFLLYPLSDIASAKMVTWLFGLLLLLVPGAAFASFKHYACITFDLLSQQIVWEDYYGSGLNDVFVNPFDLVASVGYERFRPVDQHGRIGVPKHIVWLKFKDGRETIFDFGRDQADAEEIAALLQKWMPPISTEDHIAKLKAEQK